MCDIINPGLVLNEYIKSCGYNIKDFSKLLNVPYREWHDIFWEYKAYKYSQLILDKFPAKLKNSINKLVGYD